MRRLRNRIGADRLGDAGCLPVEDAGRGLGGHVTGAETGAAGRQDDVGLVGQLLDRARDLVAVVGHDAAHHFEPLRLQELLEQVAAPVLARALGDAVGDGQNSSIHAGSLVFSSSLTSSTTICLSIALAMS